MHRHGQEAFTRGGRQEHTTGKSLQQTVLGKLETTVRRTKLQPYLTPPTKIHSTWTGNPKLRPETPTSRGEYRESAVTLTLAMTSCGVGRTPSAEAAGANSTVAARATAATQRRSLPAKHRGILQDGRTDAHTAYLMRG